MHFNKTDAESQQVMTGRSGKSRGGAPLSAGGTRRNRRCARRASYRGPSTGGPIWVWLPAARKGRPGLWLSVTEQNRDVRPRSPGARGDAHGTIAELISVIESQREILADGEAKPSTHRGKVGLRGNVLTPGKTIACRAIIEEGEKLQKIRAIRCAEQIAQPETGGTQFIADNPPVIAVDQPLVVTAHGGMATQTEFLAGKQFMV